MGSLQLISTDNVNPSERAVLIRDALFDVFGRRGSHFFSSTWPAVATFEYGTIGDIRICKLNGTGYGCEFTPSRNKDGCLEISIELEGTAYFTHAGRKLVQPPGQWTVFDTSKPFAILAPEGSHTLILTVPKERLLGGGCNLDDLILRPFSKAHGIGKVVCDFVSTLVSELPSLGSRSEPDLADTVYQLLRLSIGESIGNGSSAKQSHREFLRERIKAYIVGDLRNPDLSIDRIAGALHCTKRYLHKVFESEGLSLSDYIWQTRLDRCRSELLSTKQEARSVTEIAFSWGFSSSAHFSTAFKQRFGVPPSHCRAESEN
ncbi:MAG TPA: helix-turn-helix domain-containing protein [Candidatus Baltobacteraceae bacterium]|nr:helix-turn-helix domain-containing protein [Candidatus Baltobacteraceae bacterium]